ncbi:MAG: isopenicillin N synthase family oxygenase [Myxococcales bacterium]|nr:isopenicillin N synthase family oxygenase [Myxococcales bacterium]
MTATSIPIVDVHDWQGDDAARARFVRGVGESLADIGFFALANHGVPAEDTQLAYDTAREFFALPPATKAAYHRAGAKGQRGYTGFGTEHAKDAQAADLKEFWQVGRVDVPDTHEVHQPFGPNLWPDDDVAGFRPVMTALYRALDQLGRICLEAAALYLDEPASTFAAMADDSDTIVRVIYYPPTIDAPAGAVRSAAHEDINLITLLSGATSEGLELLRRDGTWMPVHVSFDHIVVDSGDMLQNVTNGLYKSTTHRVVNPRDAASDRYSMPCFIHPRKSVDLTPMASAVARTGGAARYPSLDAGAYLIQRLAEIGLG